MVSVFCLLHLSRPEFVKIAVGIFSKNIHIRGRRPALFSFFSEKIKMNPTLACFFFPFSLYFISASLLSEQLVILILSKATQRW